MADAATSGARGQRLKLGEDREGGGGEEEVKGINWYACNCS